MRITLGTFDSPHSVWIQLYACSRLMSTRIRQIIYTYASPHTSPKVHTCVRTYTHTYATCESMRWYTRVSVCVYAMRCDGQISVEVDTLSPRLYISRSSGDTRQQVRAHAHINTHKHTHTHILTRTRVYVRGLACEPDLGGPINYGNLLEWAVIELNWIIDSEWINYA